MINKKQTHLLNKFHRIIIITILILNVFQIFGQNKPYCFDSENAKANKFYYDATALDIYQKPMVITLLKKAIKEDTAFALAYFTLGKIYHRKALLSQYDIKNQMHTSYYFKKAHDNFIYSLELCDELSNYAAYYYLGEQFYILQEYALAGYYLEMYLKNYNSNLEHFKKAEVYLNDFEKWSKLTKNTFDINLAVAKEFCANSDEYNPFITANGQQIYYIQKATKLKPNSIYPSIEKQLYYSNTKAIDTAENWIFSKAMQFKQAQSINGIDYISFNHQNTEYYLSNSEKVKIDKQYQLRGNIYYSSFVNGFWNEPEIISNISLKDYLDSEPFLSNDEKLLFFTSNRPDGYGGMDIYYCIKNKNNEWSKPINMGENINTINDEIAPFLHYDNNTFYFASNGHLGLGGYDVFVSRKNEDSTWSVPVNMGKPINTPNDEKRIVLDARGNKAYMASNSRIGIGGWDIYSIDIPDIFRPNEMVLLNGLVYDQDSFPVILDDIEIIDLKTNRSYDVALNKLNGSFSTIVPKIKTNYYIKINATGFSYGNIVIKGTSENHTYFEAIKLQKLKRYITFYLSNIYINNNSNYQIESIQILNDFANYLKNNPRLKIKIIGTNGQNYFHKLTSNEVQKAKLTYNFLISKGISKNQVKYQTDTTLITNIPKQNPTRTEIMIEVIDYK